MTRPEKPRSEGTPRERQVRALLAEMSASGSSLAEFCRERGIPRGTLSCWRTVIRRRDAARGPVATAAPAQPVAVGVTARSPAFVRVRVRPGPPAPPAATSPLEVVLPGGTAVRVPVGFDPTTLTDLLRVLEVGRC